MKFLCEVGVLCVVMVGGIGKLGAVLRVWFDLCGAVVVSRFRHFNDDYVFRAVADEYECGGIRIEFSMLLMLELLVPVGVFGTCVFSVSEERDLCFVLEVVRVIGRADVGQTVVVEDGKVFAVEVSEGTDAMLIRGGDYGRGYAVVVKCAKSGQDLCFDLPAVGECTIELMAAYGCKVLGLEVGRALLLDGDRVIRRADAVGIALVGVMP